MVKTALSPKSLKLLYLSLSTIDKSKTAGIDQTISYFARELAEIFEAKGCFIDLNPEAELISELKQKGLLIRETNIFLPVSVKDIVCASLCLQELKNPPEDPDLLRIAGPMISKILDQAQLINDLKLSNEKLLEQDRVRSQLMSTVSHELRTPMSNILGFGELLLKRELDSQTAKQYYTEIYQAAQRLANLIHNFLDLSRIESIGQIQLNFFEECDIGLIAEEAWHGLGSMRENHKMHLKKTPENLPLVFVDIEAISRVFTNLFTNAVKYSPVRKNSQKNNVYCDLEAKGNFLLVKIRDEGIGIAKELCETVFEKFSRIEREESKHISGTGLGLWICKEIIEAHNGRIWCESLAQGSAFYLVLPLAQGKISDAQILLD
jgi:signal transduction histidine kinase